MKKNKFAWLKLIAVILPLLGFFIFVNMFFDPANIFHNVSRPIADSLLAGNSTYITSGNMDERRVKQYMIEDMPDKVDCLVMGSSVIFGIRKEHVGTESFYNLGISGADFYDLMAQFALMELNEKKAERIILSLDPYFFSDTLNASFTRNIPLKPYAEYLISLMNGETPQEPKRDSKAETKQQFIQALSVTYFQASVDYVVSNSSLNISRWGVANDGYEGAYYLPDGSMVYPASLYDSPVENVKNDAATYPLDYHFSAYEHMSPSKTGTFEKLISYLQAQGTEVVLYLSPMSPSLWERCNEDTHFLIWEIEDYAQHLNSELGLGVIGSFNPHNNGFSDEAFYDARHLRHDCLDKFFHQK